MWGDSVDSSALREKLGGLLRFCRSDSDGDFRLADDRRDSSSYGSEDRCSIRKIIRNKCNTEEVEPGKFVRKCEKTQEVFRSCVGRPTELIESKTEYTEDDVSRDSSIVLNPQGHKLDELEPYIPPIFRGELENFQQGLFGGLDTLMNAAEDIARDFFQSFGYPVDGDSRSPFERGVGSIPNEQKHREDKVHKEETGYGDLAERFEEI
ncbi:hypothetical protein SUGI_0630370 [Cryptomeria japonica]|uniref:fra a 1-associated protein n=1 Tax=Cryptomeria japonica TaxID=3369 RepID=UPI0024149177|nr:fra a 1-associated protein [Cryptomeria japonica]GLJ31416.1 hypothetical protein SUGI_0630370 [Cryptomeria japonica]